MKASNALVAAALAGVFAAGTSIVTAAPALIGHPLKADEKKDDCPGKKKDKDDCPGKKKEEKKGTIL